MSHGSVIVCHVLSVSKNLIVIQGSNSASCHVVLVLFQPDFVDAIASLYVSIICPSPFALPICLAIDNRACTNSAWIPGPFSLLRSGNELLGKLFVTGKGSCEFY